MKKEKINLRTKDDGGNDGVEPKRESEGGSCFFQRPRIRIGFDAVCIFNAFCGILIPD